MKTKQIRQTNKTIFHKSLLVISIIAVVTGLVYGATIIPGTLLKSSVLEPVKPAKAGGEALDCADTSLVNTWYKEAGRC